MATKTPLSDKSEALRGIGATHPALQSAWDHVAESPALVLAASFTCGALLGWFVKRM
jgi:hypothetical protein